ATCLDLLFVLDDISTTATYTLSLHDALPILYFNGRISGIWGAGSCPLVCGSSDRAIIVAFWNRLSEGIFPAENCERGMLFRYRRSEEHTSELQSRENLVCRLLLEKKKNEHRE